MWCCSHFLELPERESKISVARCKTAGKTTVICALKESEMALTHRELCQIAYKFLKRNGFKVCFHDRFIAVTSTGEQPDAMGFRNSASCLIEAKCSRADLLADRKSVSVKSVSWNGRLAILY